MNSDLHNRARSNSALLTDAKLPKGLAAVYVDGERIASTRQRYQVWAKADGLSPKEIPLHLTSGLILNDPTSVDSLIDAVRDLERKTGRKVGILIIDSLASVLYGMELNSSAPATLAGSMLRKIRDALNCAVGAVAHSPKKEGSETVAGSMQFDAIFDTALFMRSDDDGATGCMYAKKHNAIPLEEHEKSIWWKRELVSMEHRRSGKVVRAHRLLPGEEKEKQRDNSKMKPVKAKDKKLPGTALAKLHELTMPDDAFGEDKTTTYDAWINAVLPHAGGDRREDQRRSARRAIDKVLESGKASRDADGTVRRTKDE